MGRGPAEGAVAKRKKNIVNVLLSGELGVGSGRDGPAAVCRSRGDRTGGVYCRNAEGTVSGGGFMRRSRTMSDSNATSTTFPAAARYISSRTGGVESTSPMLSKP